ncbi:hypothetical protein ACIA03_08580 [Nocardioides sp. NPDC051685]|uniref:hypothetical protein n=1 Tax=Nocardioides sp. NPDC051685 TaxID=3364334 RepID=UPI00379125E1
MKRASNLDASGVPIFLPTVEIRIDTEGVAAVTIDEEPFELSTRLRRGGVRSLVQDLADRYGPIRVVIVEADGETYVDIETPREDTANPLPRPRGESASQRTKGPFQPDEDVLVAVVVDRRTSGPNGSVALRVPPVITQRYGGAVYLLGRTSHAVVPLTEAEGVDR